MKRITLFIASLFLMTMSLLADGSTYLNFTAVNGPATICLGYQDFYGRLDSISLQYSIDNCNTWCNYSLRTTINLTEGSKVYFKATSVNSHFSGGDANTHYYFYMSGTVAADGNIMSLLDATMMQDTVLCSFYGLFSGGASLIQAPVLPATTLTPSCYKSMFSGCTSLTQAPNLPATNLAQSCYYGMFSGCTSLTQAPVLPATTLANGCYLEMFNGCTSLTQAPALPATVLADECYHKMFYSCTSMTQAPSLPATNLAPSCYRGMFAGCTSLSQAPTLPATTLAKDCYRNMFSVTYWESPSTYYEYYDAKGPGCISLTKAPSLPATTLESCCYQRMFEGCTSLSKIPTLSATALQDSCYREMFKDCSSIKLNVLAPGDIWKIPNNASAAGASNWNTDMFSGTSGTFKGSPVIGTDYYIEGGIAVESFDVTVLANYANRGSVTGGGTYDSLEVATLTATPNEGYKFTGWDNGLTNRVINITVTSDTIITANFEPDNTAVEEVEGDFEITLAPNPVKIGETILINGNFSDEELNGMMVEVIDLNGMVVRSNEANSSPVEIEGVDAAGAYIVRITAGTGKVYTQKLIVK